MNVVSEQSIRTAANAAARESAFPVPAGTFNEYRDMVLIENKTQNLTGSVNTDEFFSHHIADSLSVIGNFDVPENAAIIDIGTGAGLPGIPLAIARPDLRVTLLDAKEKRVSFLRGCVSRLGLAAECICDRAEIYALTHLEQFDIAVSRAVADMRELTELCLPFVKTGGFFIAMKSQNCDEEIAAAGNAIETLGGGESIIRDYSLSDGTPRRLVIIPKVHTTPQGYPRKYKKISASPL